MKKTVLIAFGWLMVISISDREVATGEESYPVVWKVTDGLQAPESAYFDADSGYVFLSQIGDGGPTGKDGDGWISKLTIDGEMVKNKWVTGLNSPKGLRSHDGTLWVSDIDRIVGIDIAGGKISQTVKVPGAEFLNDLACGPEGSVYVADMLPSRIYQYKDSKISVLAKGEQIESPNGLLVAGGKLIIAAWGHDIQDDFTTKTAGRLLAMDLATGRITPITEKPTGNLDGVEADGQGGYIVTDFKAGKVLRISPDGAVKVLMTFPQGVADHAFLRDRGWLILPEMLENKLTAFDLSKAIR